METVNKSVKIETALKGNGSNYQTDVEEGANGCSPKIQKHIITPNGRIFYPCQFCNKVFPSEEIKAIHIKKCPAKDYILSIENESVQKTSVVEPERGEAPIVKKIDIKQNIVLQRQLNVNEILSKTKTAKFCNGADTLVLKEKNEASNEDFETLAQRLQNNAVTITKKSQDAKTLVETACRKCLKEFESPLELLRHSRNCHSYPKVLMALSEVKKFYAVKDRTECPICRKPLKVNFRSAFIKHLLTHTNEMKHSCDVCGKKFRRSDHMKAHQKRHVVEKR